MTYPWMICCTNESVMRDAKRLNVICNVQSNTVDGKRLTTISIHTIETKDENYFLAIAALAAAIRCDLPMP